MTNDRRTRPSHVRLRMLTREGKGEVEPNPTLAGTHTREEVEKVLGVLRDAGVPIPDASRAHAHARTRGHSPWPRDTPGKKPYLGTDPVRLTKTLIWLMRDRGMSSPDDLRGRTHAELMHAAMGMKAKRTAYATFDAALSDAMAAGWIECYESGDEEMLYLPNYRRGNP